MTEIVPHGPTPVEHLLIVEITNCTNDARVLRGCGGAFYSGNFTGLRKRVAFLPVIFRARAVRIVAAIILGGSVLIGGFSIGLFYVLAAIVMVVGSTWSARRIPDYYQLRRGCDRRSRTPNPRPNRSVEWLHGIRSSTLRRVENANDLPFRDRNDSNFIAVLKA